MSKAYLKVARELFLGATVVIDKWHVLKLFSDAMYEVRRAEQAKAEEKATIFRAWMLLLKLHSQLTRAEAERLDSVTVLYPDVGESYRMRLAAHDVYRSHFPEEAEARLDALCRRMEASGIGPMVNVAETVRNHWKEILAYFWERVTTDISEGINSVIQASKRKCRGFTRIENFMAMIYLISGRLGLAVPMPY